RAPPPPLAAPRRAAPAPAPPPPAPPPPPPAPAPPAPPPPPPPPAPPPPAPAPPPPAPAPTSPAPAPAPAPPAPSPAPSESITSETVATSPGARTRTDIGVGEEVRLTHSTGSTTWTKTAGNLSKATGASVKFTAPDTAQTVTVTGGKASITFNVIAPNDVHMDRFLETAVKHTEGHADSGIQTQPFLLPDNVSFMNVTYHEMNTRAVVTSPGVYACLKDRVHCKQVPAGAACHNIPMLD